MTKKTSILTIIVITIFIFTFCELKSGSFIPFPEKESVYRLDTLDKIIFSNFKQQEFWEYYQNQKLCSKIEIYDSLCNEYRNGLDSVIDFSNIPPDIIINKYRYNNPFNKDENDNSLVYNEVKQSIEQFDRNFIYNEKIKINVVYKINGYGKNIDTIIRSTSIFYWMYLSIYEDIEIDIIDDPLSQGYIYNNELYFHYLGDFKNEFIHKLEQYSECE